MPDHPLSLRRILVVEDEYMLADDLRRELEEAGSMVLGPVARVKDALSIIEAEALDIAVLDINLGGELAYPVADALMAHGVPFVFATGYNEADIPSRYAAVPRCEKPVEPDAMVKVIARKMVSTGT